MSIYTAETEEARVNELTLLEIGGTTKPPQQRELFMLLFGDPNRGTPGFIERYVRLRLGFCRSQLRDDDIRDIVQETALAIVNCLKENKICLETCENEPLRYIKGITVNKIREARIKRKKGRMETIPIHENTSLSTDFEQQMANQDLIQKILDSLPARYKQIMELTFGPEAKTMSVIIKTMRLSNRYHYYKLLSRARKSARAALKEYS